MTNAEIRRMNRRKKYERKETIKAVIALALWVIIPGLLTTWTGCYR